MDTILIIVEISIVWLVIWRLTVLDSMPKDLQRVGIVKDIVIAILGGPIVWIVESLRQLIGLLRWIAIKLLWSKSKETN